MGVTKKHTEQLLVDRSIREGETRRMKNGLLATIIRYDGFRDIDIKFEDGIIVKNKEYGNFKKGSISHPNLKTGVSVNELVCLYYFQNLGFHKAEKGSLKNFGFGNKELDLYNSDFYGFKIAIEYDGYISKTKNSTCQNIGHTVDNDLEKNQLCYKNNIILYRIRESHLPKLNSTSKDFYIESDTQKSKALSTTIQLIINDLEKLVHRQLNILVDFDKDMESIWRFIKENYASKYKEQRIGERKIMKDGFEAELVHYIDANHIVIKFLNDNTIVHSCYRHFQEGTIQHPNRHKYSKYLGETKTMSCGLEATVIDYLGCRNCTVQFSDGVIVKNVNHANFRKGMVGHPNINPGSHTIKKEKKLNKTRIGETKCMNNGQKATIINYLSTKNIDIEFEDGTILRHKNYKNFLAGTIANPNFNKYLHRINETRMMNCGMEATLIAWQKASDITVCFSDGTVVEHKTYRNFQLGSIAHPTIKLCK